MILLALLACEEVNQAPTFLSVNDIEVIYPFEGAIIDGRLNVEAGAVLELIIEVEEPEGQPVIFWWPGAPMGFIGDPENPYASWEVPLDFWSATWDLTVIAEDSADPPAAAALIIPVNVAIKEEKSR